MTDFLLELRSEEIPARMQDKARDDLARLFAAELAKAGIHTDAIVTFATPRRLALIARDLPTETAPVREETKGPKTSAPPQALEGFLRKTGLSQDQLTERDGVYFAVLERPGRKTADVIAEAIPAIVRAFPWPKSMRWGAASASTESLRWVRPLHGIVALLGEDVVPVEIAGVTSGAVTLGHRFHHPGPITIGSAADYVEKLHACHVIVDQDERRTIIRDRATALAAEAGLGLIEDEGLVAENAGLTEWPVPLLGRFDEAFLDVPPEVIQLTARVNQKYFVCRTSPSSLGEGDRSAQPNGGGAVGKLANAFICTANIEATDGGAKIVEGNRKVLAARLADARFFYETDLKVPLADQAKKLEKIVFHEKLGTVADKVDRVAKLARWLVGEGIVAAKPLPFRGGVGVGNAGAGLGETRPTPNPSPEKEGLALADSSPSSLGEGDQPQAGGGAEGAQNPSTPALTRGGPPPRDELGEDQVRARLADQAYDAARLAKADLVTGMVGEFPELQGLMGGYYAAAQGEDPEVAAAIRDHYKPVGQGDNVPNDPVTVAVSLADKLDTLVSFFAAGLRPSGSKDPFALRRAALAIISLLIENDLRLSLAQTVLIPIRALLGGERSDQPYHWMNRADADARYDFIDKQLLGSAGVEGVAVQPSFDANPFSPARQSVILVVPSAFVGHLLDFFADRLKVQQREAGVRHDLIDAVFALGGEDDLVRLLARVRALQAFIGTPDGTNLLAGYKRAANILKKSPLPSREGPGVGDESHDRAAKDRPTPDPSLEGRGEHTPEPADQKKPLSYTPEPAEAALIAALDTAEPAAADAVAREDFEAAMAALATLRAPIDAFFEAVTVNDADVTKRDSRLALLARVRVAVHNVADFSRIEG